MEIERWRYAEIGGREDVRPVAGDALHVTLVFLGGQRDGVVASLWDCAAGAAASRQAPFLTPEGVAAVPRTRPRLFALDLTDDAGRAAALHRAVADALAAAGLHEPEDRPFWPHLTLARARRGARMRPWAGAAVLPGGFPARRLTLYESRPSPAGTRYRALERLELAT